MKCPVCKENFNFWEEMVVVPLPDSRPNNPKKVAICKGCVKKGIEYFPFHLRQLSLDKAQ